MIIYTPLETIPIESHVDMKNKLLSFGLVGTVLAALCCFIPVLPALGLTGLLGVLYNDVILLPALVGFLILTGYAILR